MNGPQDASATIEMAAVDLNAALQRRTKAFGGLYERNAYLVYNLCLRICCEPHSASEATKAAFLSRLSAADPESDLVSSAISQALAHARDVVPVVHGAGDTESTAMLEATAKLAPPQRAALAANALTSVDIANTLGLAADAAARLSERALGELASLLAVSPAQATARCEAWLWAAPPDDVWPDLYARFYASVSRILREGDATGGEATAHAVSSTPAAYPPMPKGARGPLQRLRGAVRHRRTAAPPSPRHRIPRAAYAAAIVALVGTALIGQETGLLSSRSSGTAPTPPYPGQQLPGQASSMTPEQLDQLRQQELRQSKAYADQQARQRGGPTGAQGPAQTQAAVLAAAKQAEARRARALALRQRQAQIRQQQAQRRQPPAAPLTPVPPPTRVTPGPAPTPTTTAPARPPTTSPTPTTTSPTPSPATCLRDPDTGQYVCPQG